MTLEQHRKVEHWNNKDIATTLAVPCTIGTTVRRKIWREILMKTSVTKLARIEAVLNIEQCSTGSQCNHSCTSLYAMQFM